MHFNTEHAVFCDPLLIPRFLARIHKGIRGHAQLQSNTSGGVRDTMSSPKTLKQGRSYYPNASVQTLLTVLIILHYITCHFLHYIYICYMQSIIDTWYDPHKCHHIMHNYSYQCEPDCPCIDVIFPSPLIRLFCLQVMQHWQCTCSLAWITKLFWRVPLNASFPV